MFPSAKPSSRSSKKQVTVFLPVDIADEVRTTAASRERTLQQFLAEAINAELERQGHPKVLTPFIQHMFVRRALPSQARLAPETPGCRRGTKVIAGWFDRVEVDSLIDLCEAKGRSLQSLAESSLIAAIHAPSEHGVET